MWSTTPLGRFSILILIGEFTSDGGNYIKSALHVNIKNVVGNGMEDRTGKEWTMEWKTTEDVTGEWYNNIGPIFNRFQ